MSPEYKEKIETFTTNFSTIYDARGLTGAKKLESLLIITPIKRITKKVENKRVSRKQKKKTVNHLQILFQCFTITAR